MLGLVDLLETAGDDAFSRSGLFSAVRLCSVGCVGHGLCPHAGGGTSHYQNVCAFAEVGS